MTSAESKHPRKTSEKTPGERSSGGRRRKRKDEEGGLVPKLNTEGRGVDAELPGCDEEEEGRDARKTERKTNEEASHIPGGTWLSHVRGRLREEQTSVMVTIEGGPKGKKEVLLTGGMRVRFYFILFYLEKR
ncbi:hypothetical protein NDU88_007066 [Pleurodeles waltl]|uniref:Uncharacterized protein n=1 Tax=Pleurodeles waltl TaxID=8319 RepID=A0AAV7RQR7_PLEWA|nr:hypothetical protein NDU88_007066 [Pleurodeles waltl]